MQNNSNVILYIPPTQRVGSRLKKNIEAVVMEDSITLVQSAENLDRILRKPLNNVDAAVLLNVSEESLLDILPLRDSLLRIPVILILSDQKNQTLAKGHTLRPRFIGYTDSDFRDVRAVLKKLIRKSRDSFCEKALYN
jgi:hypothetical protein